MNQHQRLDQLLFEKKLVTSRSQASSYIKLGHVLVDGKVQTKPGFLVPVGAKLYITTKEQYVSRAGLKLASIADIFKLDFRGKTVLDVGSSTGGFTDYALRHGAKKVIAVELGKDQLHPSLRDNDKIELYEQTDVRNIFTQINDKRLKIKDKIIVDVPDIVLIDVSFISLREILPHVSLIVNHKSLIVPMVKPQFEAASQGLKHKGVIKNEHVRRDILKNFEEWARANFVIVDKADSDIAGAKGNRERFYLLNIARK